MQSRRWCGLDAPLKDALGLRFIAGPGHAGGIQTTGQHSVRSQRPEEHRNREFSAVDGPQERINEVVIREQSCEAESYPSEDFGFALPANQRRASEQLAERSREPLQGTGSIPASRIM